VQPKFFLVEIGDVSLGIQHLSHIYTPGWGQLWRADILLFWFGFRLYQQCRISSLEVHLSGLVNILLFLTWQT